MIENLQRFKMLSTEERLLARQFNLRSRQLFWRGIVPESHPAWHMDEESLVDWVCDYQSKHRLLVDGCFGPSTLIVMLAESRGGLGGFIIDGKEVVMDGVRVARMFVPGNGQIVKPDLCCVLSIPELDYACRDRVNGRLGVRAHFSIDSSRGPDGESLIVQWADPMRAVPFCPVFETVDYPRRRQCVGVEFETVLLLYQLDSDERRWQRRRPVVKAPIGKRVINQPILYGPQLKAFEHIMDMLEKHLGIPKKYPNLDGTYHTDLLEAEHLEGYSGYLAKFNYFQMNNEPGAGFVDSLDRIFGKLETVEQSVVGIQGNAEAVKPALDLSRFDDKRQELAGKPEPTSSFVPEHEDGPRFSLAQAIASAYGTGRGARAGRIVDRCRKFDND